MRLLQIPRRRLQARACRQVYVLQTLSPPHVLAAAQKHHSACPLCLHASKPCRVPHPPFTPERPCTLPQVCVHHGLRLLSPAHVIRRLGAGGGTLLERGSLGGIGGAPTD